MIWFYAYFLGAALIAAVVAFLFWPKPRRTLIRIAACVFATSGLPYVVVEAQSLQHQDLILAARQEFLNEGLGTASTAKVLFVSGQSANVYVVKPGQVGATVPMRNKGGKWTLSGDVNYVWASKGSASGNTFPPYLWGKG